MSLLEKQALYHSWVSCILQAKRLLANTGNIIYLMDPLSE